MDTKTVIYIICVKPLIPPKSGGIVSQLSASHKMEKHSHKPEQSLPSASHQVVLLIFLKPTATGDPGQCSMTNMVRVDSSSEPMLIIFPTS